MSKSTSTFYVYDGVIYQQYQQYGTKSINIFILNNFVMMAPPRQSYFSHFSRYLYVLLASKSARATKTFTTDLRDLLSPPW